MDFFRDILIFLGLLLISSASAVQIIPADDRDRTCYECSIEYAQLHPDYGVVTMAYNQYFLGSVHMVNYKVADNKSLLIHDGYWDSDYILNNWLEDERFMHFWLNETPARSCKYLYDNKIELYNNTE